MMTPAVNCSPCKGDGRSIQSWNNRLNPIHTHTHAHTHTRTHTHTHTHTTWLLHPPSKWPILCRVRH